MTRGMPNSMMLAVLSVALLLGACSGGKSGGGGNSNLPPGAYDAAKAQVLDAGFKKCGEYWGAFHPRDMGSGDSEWQFKNLQMVVQTSRIPLSEADKMNGVQWQGLINLSADLTRSRSKGQTEWGKWTDGFGGYGGPNSDFLMREVNGKFVVNALFLLGVKAECPA